MDLGSRTARVPDFCVEFYLLRHGEAVPEWLDPERPLTRAGRDDVDRVARAAARRNARVSEILHSGVRRARESAEIASLSLSPPRGVREISGLRPQDDPWLIMGELEASPEPWLLIGHLPHLSRLLGLMLHGDPDRVAVEFETATLVCCARCGGSWKHEWTLAPSTV